MRNDLYDSYAPKKTNPPIDIHMTLGCIPLKNTDRPSSRINLSNTSRAPVYGTPCLSDPSINLVFITSNGVVNPAAIPPETDPHAAAWSGLASHPCALPTSTLNLSYSGNCMNANGTSLMSVIPYPRYNPPNIDDAKARLSLSDNTEFNVEASVDDPAALVCILDLTTSVGTLTRHAAASPIEAAIMCVSAGEYDDSGDPSPP
mmetsp:Transcript_8093/g.19916  ORF Transcript_8093/g.19916 Transcript_8093/m.19916 type:complete len:203 (-) Transcript_8093:225-833(-)